MPLHRYQQIKREFRNNLNIIIPIDTINMNQQIFQRLETIYSTRYIHLVLCGPLANTIIKTIPTNLFKSVSALETDKYNYAKAVNIGLERFKYLSESPDDIVIISDMYISVSPVMLEKELTNYPYKNTYPIIRVFRNTEDFNFDIPNIHSSVVLRLDRIRDFAVEKSPIIVLSIDQIESYKLRFSENLSTDLSRLDIINQLNSIDVKPEYVSVDALDFRQVELYPEETKKDLDYLNKLYNKKYTFLNPKLHTETEENNHEINKLKKSHIIHYTNKNKKILTKSLEFQNTELELPILILIDGDISNQIASTPLIKKLFSRYGTIDAFLNISDNIIIKSNMVNILKNCNDITKYKTVIRTNGFESNLIEYNYQFNNKINDKILSNYTFDRDVGEGINITIPKPYLNVSNELNQKTNKLVISIINSTQSRHFVTWKGLESFVSYLANNPNYEIRLITIDGEKTIFQNKDNRPNIISIENTDVGVVYSVLKNSNVILTHPNTSVSWIGLTTNVPMILIDVPGYAFPSSNSVIKISKQNECQATSCNPNSCSHKSCLNFSSKEVFDLLCMNI